MQNHDSMQMIWHHNVSIHYRVLEVLRSCCPAFEHKCAQLIQFHLAVADATE